MVIDDAPVSKERKLADGERDVKDRTAAERLGALESLSSRAVRGDAKSNLGTSRARRTLKRRSGICSWRSGAEFEILSREFRDGFRDKSPTEEYGPNEECWEDTFGRTRWGGRETGAQQRSLGVREEDEGFDYEEDWE